MTARDLFLDRAGSVRPPWRLLFFAAATVAALAVLQRPVLGLVSAAGGGPAAVTVAVACVLLVALAAGHWLTLASVERDRGWRMVALDRPALRPRAIVKGALLGAAAIAGPSLALLAVGWLRPESAAEGSSALTALAVAVVLAPSAMWEEMLFRGYPFALLAEWWGPTAALVVTSLAFGLVHVWNPGVSPVAVAVVVLAGFFLGGVLLATGSLYAAFAAHLAWNWTLAGVLHASVSGIPFATPDYRVVDAGPDWATGGPWGPEGGAAAAAGLVSAGIYLYTRRARRGE